MIVVDHYVEKGKKFKDIAVDLMISKYNRRKDAEKKKDKETEE